MSVTLTLAGGAEGAVYSHTREKWLKVKSCQEHFHHYLCTYPPYILSSTHRFATVKSFKHLLAKIEQHNMFTTSLTFFLSLHNGGLTGAVGS